MTVDLTAALRTARVLADLADQRALSGFAGPFAVDEKADGSPVTTIDRDIERALRRALATSHPDHAVLGEEQGGDLSPDVPTWVLDPIDGTRNFVRGIPVFATLIALVVDGRAVLGVVSAPALGERWEAVQDRGTRRNGVAVHVSAVPALGKAHLCHGGLTWLRQDAAAWQRLGKLVDAAERTRGFGDFWMHLLVAGGMADAAFERDLSLWDLAALLPIVEEAGGRVSTFAGGDPLTGDGSLLSSNGLLHDDVAHVLTGAE